jgi:hypothetical protein
MNKRMNKQTDNFIEIPRLSEINNFPFKTHSEFVASIKSGLSTVGIEYTIARELINISKSKFRVILFKSMIWLPNILIILSIVLSIYKSNWFILIGILSSFFGEFIANPYNPLKNIFVFLTLLAYGYLFYSQNIFDPISWSCFSFAISFSSIFLINRFAWNWVYKDMLKSEDLTVRLFLSGNLHIKLKDGQYFSNKK